MPNKGQPLVAVVVLNFNGHEDTVACIESLRGATYRALRLIVVDNGSTRPGLGAVRDVLADGEFIGLGENRGFSAGNNVGIRAAVAGGAEYVALLNNDTVVAPGFLEPLIDTLASDLRLAAATGTILSWHAGPTDLIWYAGGRLSRIRGEGIRPRVGEALGVVGDSPQAVSFISGCFIVMPAKVLVEEGMLDEDFFVGAEDIDLSWRLQTRGYRLVYVPASVLWHRGGRSREFTPAEVYRGYVSKILLMRKRLSKWSYGLWLTGFTLFIAAVRLPLASRRLRGAGFVLRSGPARHAIGAALRDAWRGQFNTRYPPAWSAPDDPRDE
jgi:GT2 family glycosyltransferase